MSRFWAGVDAGKYHHHCVLIDDAGRQLLSRRVPNDEQELLDLIVEVNELCDGSLCWATDLNHGGAALFISLLANHGQELLYIPGRTVHHASKTYRGDGKTDARDAAVIADQARMRNDLQELRSGDAVSSSLRVLNARRADIVADRTRAFNRLRATLLEYFPALEAAFDYANTRAALMLLTRYQTAAQLRRAGRKRVSAWLSKMNCRGADAIADKAVAAAEAQFTVVGAETVSAEIGMCDGAPNDGPCPQQGGGDPSRAFYSRREELGLGGENRPFGVIEGDAVAVEELHVRGLVGDVMEAGRL